MAARRKWEVCLLLLAAFAAAGLLAGFRTAPADAYIYFGNLYQTGKGTIARANLDGSGVNTHFIVGTPPPNAIAVDGGHIYWIWASSDSSGAVTGAGIGRANLDGSGANVNFISGLSAAQYVEGYASVAVDSAHIYFTWSGMQIGRANLDGSGVDQSFIADPSWADSTTAGPESVTVENPYVYWYAGDEIGRANLDGSGINKSFIPHTGGHPTYGLVAAGAHLYWTLAAESGGGSIARVNSDGGAMDKGFISPLSSPEGLAVNSTHIYWYTLTGLDHAKLDGSGATGRYLPL